MATRSNEIIRRRKDCRSLRRRDGLIRYARNNTSQNGEDGIISRLFELLPASRQRWAVDVGAWDGVHLSNTHSLLVGGEQNDAGDGEKSKWNGVLIEADPQRFQDLEMLHRPLDNLCICAEVSCRPDSPQSLPSILNRDAPHLPRDFDFLSIDVDGIDYWLLDDIIHSESAQSSFRPKVVCIEFNPTMPIDLVYIQPRDDNIRHGSSLSALVELANASGYTLVETTLFNAFFVRKELYERYLSKEVPDTSIEALHEITMGTELYQLYDGTMKLWGCKKMLWHRLPMEEKKMQMLPSDERSFPFAPSSEGVVSNGLGDNGKSEMKNIAAIDSDDKVKSDHIRELAIDMSPYCLGSEEPNSCVVGLDRRRECCSRLNDALQKDGFALVKGTGVPGKLCESALQTAKSFLHDADESVRRSCLTKDRARRGYSPICTENFASLIGKHGPNDLVKKFRLGPEKSSNEGSTSSLHQPNAWPNDETWDPYNASFFRSSVEEYFERTCHAADCILSAICDGLIAGDERISESVRVFSKLPEPECGTESSRDTNSHTSILTLLGYQPGSRHKKGSKGYMRPLVSAHTDVGVITMLHFDNGQCASLQRAANAGGEDPDNNKWIDVNLPPTSGEDPVFVINVGDCLSELSGGTLRSSLHRVVPRPCLKTSDVNVARTCLALFVGLEPSASLTLPSGEVISYEKWRQQRIARATAVLNANS
ncbi:hypothetical protein ACHAWF_012458 [Thalassiosira exigua]